MAERWHVSFHPAFDAEFQVLPEAIQDEVAALAEAIAVAGPQLGRPRVDTLLKTSTATISRRLPDLRAKALQEATAP
jgi:hypothetical protein